jgi:hypothetical protein
MAKAIPQRNFPSCAPILFVHPKLREQETGARGLRVRKPLFGEDLWVTKEDFARYHAATLSFWDDLAAQLRGLTQ